MLRFIPGKTILVFLALFSGSLVIKAQEPVFAITSSTISNMADAVNLVTFNTNTPGNWTTIGALSGVLPGHSVRTIDWRPSNGIVYAMSTNSSVLTETQLYTVNTATAALTPVGSTFTITGNQSRAIEMDFNPVTDELRVITRWGQNIRVNPTTGAIASIDTNLAYVAGDLSGISPVDIDILGVAHGNDGTLFGWEFTNDALVRIGGNAGSPPASNGLVTSIDIPNGFLTGSGTNVSMDVGRSSNTLFTAHETTPNSGTMSFFTRDMASGSETLLGAFGTGNFVVDFTIVPEPGSMIAGTAAVVAVGGWIRRRRKQAVAAPITTA